jgi:hypothetical protein
VEWVALDGIGCIGTGIFYSEMHWDSNWLYFAHHFVFFVLSQLFVMQCRDIRRTVFNKFNRSTINKLPFNSMQ